MSAFDGDSEVNLVTALRNEGFLEVSLVAEVDDVVLGHIAFSRIKIRTSTGEIAALSLAPMAVLPGHQRKGIGTQLAATGVKVCRERGHALVLVLGHPQFYPRIGFSANLAKRIVCPYGSGDAWMGLELKPGLLENIEGAVEFSAPFHVLESLDSAVSETLINNKDNVSRFAQA